MEMFYAFGNDLIIMDSESGKPNPVRNSHGLNPVMSWWRFWINPKVANTFSSLPAYSAYTELGSHSPTGDKVVEVSSKCINLNKSAYVLGFGGYARTREFASLS